MTFVDLLRLNFKSFI